MTTFILLRHGESEANGTGVFTGALDVSLSENGKRQAELFKEYAIRNLKVDKIYASPLHRAPDTVLPFALEAKLPIEKRENLRELFGGEWEGKTSQTIKELYPKEYKAWKEDTGNSRPTGGESTREAQARGIKELETLAKENEGKTVLIATHAALIRAMFPVFLGVDTNEMKNIPFVGNASITTVRYDGGKFTMLSADDDSYLGGLSTRIDRGF